MKQPIPFGKYFLLERVNVGGMAEVFKAKATGVEGFERLVAVKRILPSIAEDEEFITMFVDEAKIAVQLTHANIAQIFDLGRVEGSFFIALEYVHGKDLRAMFNRTRQRGEILPVPLSCYVIMKLCEGLDYAHNKHDSAGRFLNLVHRDVSPQNILVSYEGEVKIIDFGIAKAAGKVGRTQAGILKGKFGYMSPEQVLGLEIDRRSDVFGVGICLYELLTGERLFVAESDFATLEKVRSVDIMPPSTYNRRIPEELEQIVLRALARDRDLRYQSALQLHDDLQAFMHTSGNLFSRKDLSGYMHRVFGEEIEKESARDREFEASEHAEHAEDDDMGMGSLEALEPMDRLGTLPEEPRHYDDDDDDEDSQELVAPPQPEARRRTTTLLGVPRAVARVPTVPRPIPGPGSIPPLSSARPSPASMSALAAQSSHGHGMEWDDEELSTQIYDKPDQRSEDELDTLHVSLPQSASPDERGFLGHVPSSAASPLPRADPYRQEFRTYPPPTWPPPPPTQVGGGATVSSRAPTQRLPWQPPPAPPPKRGRPMLAAVLAVVSIVACIVLGLLVFGQREPGTVNLTTRPSRVAVSVDGRALGVSTSPFVIGELSPGRRHDIEVSSPGYKPWTRVVELEPGEVLPISDIELERIETGFTLSSEPAGATVYVDDKSIPGRTPVRVVDLAPGEHRVRVEQTGWSSWETTVHATTGTVLPLPQVSLQPLVVARGDQPLPPPVELSAAPTNPRAKSGSRWTRAARSGGDEPTPRAAANNNSDDNDDDADDAEEDKPEPARSQPVEPPAPDPQPKARPDPVAEAAPSPQAQAVEATPASAAASGGETGTLRVNSRPWSQVFIDGRPFGSTPRMNIELPVGPHKLELVNDEFSVRRTIELTIVAGKIETRVINLLE
ncbi:MAG: PEGA domain-containing protein [Polyangiales bacterium]